MADEAKKQAGHALRERANALKVTPAEIMAIFAFLAGAAPEQLGWALDMVEENRARPAAPYCSDPAGIGWDRTSDHMPEVGRDPR